MSDRVAPIITLILVASSAGADETIADRARRHFEQGNSFAALRRFADAADEYERGYELSRDPIFLHNLAQAFTDRAALANDQNDTCAYSRRAVFEWRKFLATQPLDEQSEEIERRIDELDLRVGACDKREQRERLARACAACGAPPCPVSAPPAAITVRIRHGRRLIKPSGGLVRLRDEL
jgi:hypothetical protein